MGKMKEGIKGEKEKEKMYPMNTAKKAMGRVVSILPGPKTTPVLVSCPLVRAFM